MLAAIAAAEQAVDEDALPPLQRKELPSAG
jgi:hypothetical protein